MREGSVILNFGVEGTDSITRSTAQREARYRSHEGIVFLDCSDMDDSLSHIENWHLVATQT